MTTENLDRYLQLNYEVKVIKQEENFFLFIPDLQIIIQDTDLNRAHSKLENAKRHLIQQYFDLGREQAIPLPSEVLKKRQFLSKMTPFLLKMSVFTLVALLLIVTANISFTYILEETPKMLAKKAFQVLETYELTPESAEKYHRGLQTIVRKWKPFTNELIPLFHLENETSTIKE